MNWQVLIAQPIASLTVVLAVESLLRSSSRRAPTLVRVWVALSIVLTLCVALGSPMYRRGGRNAAVADLRADAPFLDEYHVRDHCTVVINPRE